MKKLANNEMKEVNGGFIFMVVPAWAVIGTVTAELAIIHAMAK